MVVKTYKTVRLKGFSVQAEIDGKFYPIVFKRGCTLDSTATYTTSDPRIQKELESLSSFGLEFFIEEEMVVGEDVKKESKVENTKVTITPEPEEEKEVVDILDAQTFKNLVELRNALQAKGIDVSQITNVKAAEAIAKKNGYNYTIDKNA